MFLQCASSKRAFNNQALISKQVTPYGKNKLSKELLRDWHYLDIESDSVSGISWYKALKMLNANQNQKDVIVAIIDTEMDIHHIGLSANIWNNPNEIKGNGIDDDKNGYIDDINGWNFLGNNKGDNIMEANLEYVRQYRFLRDKVNQLDTTKLSIEQKKTFNQYKEKKAYYEEKRQKTEKRFNRSDKLFTKYLKAKEALKKYFPNSKYSTEVLNTIDTINNGLGEHVRFIHLLLKYKDNDANITRNYNSIKGEYLYKINVNFDEREILKENPNNLSDNKYGNNNVAGNLDKYIHATKVAGVVKDNYIKLMPLAIAPYGDTHDKDIALAIRYAVDNGAKIINMSFGKFYSLHKEWVFDALKYAEKHDVLVVSSAGNNGYNLNEINNYYPNDNTYNGKEVSDNFLLVGVSSAFANENLFVSYSNYGNIDVDLFAPGEEVYTTIPNNEYTYDGGTSLAAALTSKVAALIFSYYPNLTASQVKHIIMDSGVEYTFPVKTPTREDKDKMTPFNELSKSGKIVNAYNALIMADSISRKH